LKNKLFNLLFVKEGKIYLLFTLCGLIATSVLGYFIPIYIKSLAETYKTSLFLVNLTHLAYIFILVYITRIVYGLSIMKYTTILMQFIRTEVYSKWLMSSETIFEGKVKNREYPQGEIMSRIMSDTESLRELVTSGTLNIIIESVLVISCFVSFISINTKLGVILIILEVGVIVLFLIGSKKMRESFLRVRQTRGKLSHIIANSIGGVNELFFNIHNNYIIKRSTVIFDKYLKDILNSIFWDASYYSLSESIIPIFLVIIVFLIPYTQITEAALILTVVDLIQRSIRPLKSVASQIGNVQRAYGGLFRVRELLNDFQTINYKENNLNIIDVKKICFSIDSFEYPSVDESKQFKLENIHLKLNSGNKYAFVGLSGCGKSTLLNIISGSIIPSKYHILVNEYSIDKDDESSLNWYRKHVGLISQDSHVFSDSLCFNITFQNTVSDKLNKFWNGLTKSIPYLAEWGIKPEDLISVDELSAGQKQLIAAIRSLYLRKEIVLFDEISSSLDSKLEHSLSTVIDLISQKSITVFVAHRIETIIKCDTIYMMDNGKIIDKGSHKDLEKVSLLYQNFLKELSRTHQKESL